MSHLLLETGLFHSLLVLIYTFSKALSNEGSWHDACVGAGRVRSNVLWGANQIKSTTNRQHKTKAVLNLCFYYGSRKLSDPARNRFSFNYMFHVCVPRLHAQRLLSRPNISHAYPRLNTQPNAYQNRTAEGLWQACVYICAGCISIWKVYVCL